jgi:hypothetical protein
MASSTLATSKPLSFMEKLGPLVSVYHPAEAAGPAKADSPQQPRLVIFASWTDAKDAHIAKYINKYRALFPATPILLLKSTTTQIVWTSTIGPAMKAAVSVVREVFVAATPTSSPSSPELLIHMLSNGGSSSIANLFEQYAASARPGEDACLPPHVTIMDSCPCIYSITHGVTFASIGLSPIQRTLLAPVLYVLAVIWSGMIAVGFIPNAMSDWGKAHNHHPGNAKELRRAYIYSAVDILIDYKQVEAHASAAQAQGFAVFLEKYQGSAHVAHIRKDEDRYWAIVKGLFDGTL